MLNISRCQEVGELVLYELTAIVTDNDGWIAMSGKHFCQPCDQFPRGDVVRQKDFWIARCIVNDCSDEALVAGCCGKWSADVQSKLVPYFCGSRYCAVWYNNWFVCFFFKKFLTYFKTLACANDKKDSKCSCSFDKVQ